MTMKPVFEKTSAGPWPDVMVNDDSLPWRLLQIPPLGKCFYSDTCNWSPWDLGRSEYKVATNIRLLFEDESYRSQVDSIEIQQGGNTSTFIYPELSDVYKYLFQGLPNETTPGPKYLWLCGLTSQKIYVHYKDIRFRPPLGSVTLSADIYDLKVRDISIWKNELKYTDNEKTKFWNDFYNEYDNHKCIYPHVYCIRACGQIHELPKHFALRVIVSVESKLSLKTSEGLIDPEPTKQVGDFWVFIFPEGIRGRLEVHYIGCSFFGCPMYFFGEIYQICGSSTCAIFFDLEKWQGPFRDPDPTPNLFGDPMPEPTMEECFHFMRLMNTYKKTKEDLLRSINAIPMYAFMVEKCILCGSNNDQTRHPAKCSNCNKVWTLEVRHHHRLRILKVGFAEDWTGISINGMLVLCLRLVHRLVRWVHENHLNKFTNWTEDILDIVREFVL